MHDLEPIAAALALVPCLPPEALAAFIERAIERLDELDGDADEETQGADDGVYGGRFPGDRSRLTPDLVRYKSGYDDDCELASPAETWGETPFREPAVDLNRL